MYTCVCVCVCVCVYACVRVDVCWVSGLWSGVGFEVLGLGNTLCSVLQCVAVCCSVLQCVAVCCSVLQDLEFRQQKL